MPGGLSHWLLCHWFVMQPPYLKFPVVCVSAKASNFNTLTPCLAVPFWSLRCSILGSPFDQSMHLMTLTLKTCRAMVRYFSLTPTWLVRIAAAGVQPRTKSTPIPLGPSALSRERSSQSPSEDASVLPSLHPALVGRTSMTCTVNGIMFLTAHHPCVIRVTSCGTMPGRRFTKICHEKTRWISRHSIRRKGQPIETQGNVLDRSAEEETVMWGCGTRVGERSEQSAVSHKPM